MKPIQVGLLGIGTVGSGVFTVLERNQDEILRRAGRGIRIHTVADLNVGRAKELVHDRAQIVSDARAVIANPEIDIVVELIGGYGIAKDLVLEAIAAGVRPVLAGESGFAEPHVRRPRRPCTYLRRVDQTMRPARSGQR